MQPKTFIFISRSGAGKGTQAKLLKKLLEEKNGEGNVLYFESGKCFREYVEDGSYSAKISKRIMDEGELQPSFLAVRGWANYFVSCLNENSYLILDGSPRTLIKAQELDEALNFYKRNAYVLYLNISREQAVERLSLRGRKDDVDINNINMRMDWFGEQVMPIVEFYKNGKTHTFLDIDASKTIEEIFDEIKQKINLENE